MSGADSATVRDGHGPAALDTPVHRLDPRAKIVGLIAIAVVSVSTPPGAWAAFAAYAALLVGLAALARLPARHVLSRMTVEVPFLLAAAILPFVAPDGLLMAGTVASKATIGVLAMVVLSSTTPFPRLLRGFEALRVPAVLILVVGFMWRYLHVLIEEVRRGHTARQARGYDPRWLWQAGAIARGIGTLFVRSLERGERVHLAMLARGYTGGMPAVVGERLVWGRAESAFAVGLGAVLVLVRAGLA